MTLESLYEKIKAAVSDNALALSADIYENEAISTVLVDYLNSATMQIGIAVEPILTEDSITIRGTFIEGVFANIAVTVVFTQEDDTNQVEITIEPTDDWSIAQYVSDFQGTTVDELDITRPILILSSSADSKGIQLIATVNFTGPLEPVGAILGDVQSLSIDGTVSRDGDGTSLALTASYEGEVDLGGFSVIDLIVSINASTAVDSPTELMLEGTVSLDADPDPIAIPLSAEIVTGESMIFTAVLSSSDSEDGVDTSLDALGGLLSVSYLDSVLPESVDIGESVALHDLVIVLDMTGVTSRVESISSGVMATQPWKIVGDDITVDELVITFTVTDPGGVRELTAALHGVIAIA